MLAVCLGLLLLDSPTISPYDKRVHLIGRFDTHDKASVTCSWPGTGVELLVKSPDIKVELEESGDDLYQVEVDGKPLTKMALRKGRTVLIIPLPFKDKPLKVRLIKRTEPSVGTTTFTSFSIGKGSFQTPKPLKRHIEIVGDSISCGYGNEGANEKEPFTPETENAYMTYGSIAARDVDAEVSIIAWSGRLMYPRFTMPEIYDRVDANSTREYDFSGPTPDAIVINLATNDFRENNPEESPWVGAYEAFIARLRSHYPKAYIYPSLGPMMSDGWPKDHKALSTLRDYLTRMVERLNKAGDKRIKLLEFAEQDQEKDGIGANWHPNITTHQKMADVLKAHLKEDLGW